MSRYRITIPRYFTATVDAASEDDAYEKYVKQGQIAMWDEDDPQPALDFDDCNFELEEQYPPSVKAIEEAAKELYGSEDIEITKGEMVNHGELGAWVSAKVYVPYAEVEVPQKVG